MPDPVPLTAREPYCSFRNHGLRRCDPPVTSITKTRVRFGKEEQFVYSLCEYHAKVAKR